MFYFRAFPADLEDTEKGNIEITRVVCSCSEVYYQEQGWRGHLVNTKQAKEAPWVQPGGAGGRC